MTVKVARAVIVADHRLDAAGKAVVQGKNDLHDAVEDGHGAHIQVAAIGLQAVVQHQGDGAFGDLHDKGGDTQSGDAADHIPPGTEIPQLQPQVGPGRGQKAHHPQGAEALGEHGGQSGAPDAHIQGKNEDGVQKDIAHGADEYRAHGHLGFALAGNKGVEAHGQLHEQGAHQIDGQVLVGKGKGLFAGAHQIQQGLLNGKKQSGQRCRKHQQQKGAVAQNTLGRFPVFFAQKNGGDGRAAAAHQGGKRADGQNDGKGEAQAGEGQVTVFGHVADINAVDNVIEQVDDLGHHGGQRQLEHQWPQRGFGQSLLGAGLIFHDVILPEFVR